jgi:hypothetical protein
MSDERSTGSPAEGALQFDRAEHTQEAAGLSCAMCGTPLLHQYYDANGKHVCEVCRHKVEAVLAARPGAAGFFKALIGGLGGAAVGAGVYYAVLAITHYELSIIAILVGWLVGNGVRWGAQGKGGWAYQTLAVFLTYMAIVSTYIPMIIKGIQEGAEQTTTAAAPVDPTAKPASNGSGGATPLKAVEARPTPSAGQLFLTAVLLLGFAAMAPFLGGFQNILGIVIIGIGVWQAWKINRRPTLDISGPYEVGRS